MNRNTHRVWIRQLLWRFMAHLIHLKAHYYCNKDETQKGPNRSNSEQQEQLMFYLIIINKAINSIFEKFIIY